MNSTSVMLELMSIFLLYFPILQDHSQLFSLPYTTLVDPNTASEYQVSKLQAAFSFTFNRIMHCPVQINTRPPKPFSVTNPPN